MNAKRDAVQALGVKRPEVQPKPDLMEQPEVSPAVN
jgi:hypothetical protein